MMKTIAVEIRDLSVKAKHIRKAGQVPCSIYGGSLPQTLLVQFSQNVGLQMLRDNREGSQVKLTLDNKPMLVQIKEVERNFLNGELTHISFQALSADKPVHTKAYIDLLGKDQVPGNLEQLVFEVPYTALPEDMVDTVTIDLTGKPLGTVITLEELPEFQSDKLQLLIAPDSVVLKIRDQLHGAAQTGASESDTPTA